VSLFTDLSSEMIVPLLPEFLLGLGASAGFLGLVEGAADAVAALLKLASGVWADRVPRKKPLVVAGYALASTVRPLVALATAPWHVLLVRFVDRVGKGIRSTPRDALIAAAVPADRHGAAFGFHEAMDHAGALLGPLLAFMLGTTLGWSARELFALAAAPAALAMLTVVFGVVEDRPADPAPPSDPAPGAAPRLPARLWLYLALVGAFTLANSTDAFLLLRAHALGVENAALPLLWALLHLSKSLLAAPLGALSDRLGRAPVIVAGWIAYALVYLGFAWAAVAWQAWALFAAYGIYFGLVGGAEKALVTELAPPALRGRAFGAFNAVVGLLALPSSVGFGLALDRFGPAPTFTAAAALAALSAIGLAGLAVVGAPAGTRSG
jgi:MFS family permease